MENQPSSRWSLIIVGVVIGLVWGTLIALIVLSLTVVRSEVASRPAPAVATPVYPVTKSAAGQEQAKSAGGQQIAAVGGGATGTEVVISNQTFAPHTLIVATGATITWHNETPWRTRSPATTAGSIRASSRRAPIARGRRTSPAPSPITATIHPGMEGVLIVQPGGAVAAPLFDGKTVEAGLYR